MVSMSSEKIQTSLRMDPLIHKWALDRARAEDRTLSQFICHVLRLAKDGAPKPVSVPQLPAMAPPARPASPRPAMPPPTSRDLFLLENWNLRMIDTMSIDDFRRRRDAGELKGYQEMLDELGDI
jgi:hypothetical protein